MPTATVNETIDGDNPSVSYRLKVFRFSGRQSDAASAYIQGGLHAGELPGVAAADALLPLLRKADEEGRINGNITVVPHANPIGRSQYHFGEMQGRFDLGTRANFNRQFPKVVRPDASVLPPVGPRDMADARLRHRLMQLSLGHDIILDLHCDDEGIAYVYAPALLWPAMEDCVTALGLDAVIVWDGSSMGSFDEVQVDALRGLTKNEHARRVVLTVEYRGLRDVDRHLAQADALGVYRLLAQRRVLDDPDVAEQGGFRGRVGHIEAVETIPAPVGGTVLYDVGPGETVAQGQRLASIVFDPGEPEGRVDIVSPQSGLIVTRRRSRAARAGEDLMKILCSRASTTPKGIPFED